MLGRVLACAREPFSLDGQVCLTVWRWWRIGPKSHLDKAELSLVSNVCEVARASSWIPSENKSHVCLRSWVHWEWAEYPVPV